VTWEETLRALLKDATPGPLRTLNAGVAITLLRDQNSDPVANVYGYQFDPFKRESDDDRERSVANAETLASLWNARLALADLVEAAREACLYSGNVGWRAQGALLELEEALARLDGVK